MLIVQNLCKVVVYFIKIKKTKLNKGIVIKSTGSSYTVQTEDNRLVICKIRGKFRTKGLRTTNPLAVGDRVKYIKEENAALGLITERFERKNYLIRKSINLSKESHVLAANIDQAIIVVTINQPKTYPEFIDRFLVSAEAYRIPAVVVFNKIDLYEEKEKAELEELKRIYKQIGYHCIEISAKKKTNIFQIKELLDKKTSVIAGHSGVGKSTLINTIAPHLKLKTNEISTFHQVGKHTTTFPEMHFLGNKTYIIDTPGIKGFGIIDIENEELMHFFPEIFALLPACKYNNCLHLKEPDCAVKKALEEKKISPSRYKSYLSILSTNNDEKHRTVSY